MRMTRLHAPTLKEDPKDAEVVSHKYLVRGGYIRKLAAGIYDFLPLATRTIHKIANIVRDQKILEVAKREAEFMLNERGRTRETDQLIQHVRSQPRFGLARVG